MKMIEGDYIITKKTDAKKTPNIIFILTDDWGYGDLGCYNNEEIQTPNIDKLAEEVTRFTDFHVASPVCSPSRCAFMTGHYPARHLVHGHYERYDHNTARHMNNWLDKDVHTLPKLLKEAGYRTAHYGKWHLGGGGGQYGHPDAPPVIEYGYDATRVWNGNGPTWLGTEKWPFTLFNDIDKVWAANSSRMAIEETLEFIKQDKDKPFFINLWLKDPHTPLHPTKEQREPYKDLEEPRQTYYSVLTNADKYIGVLMEELEAMGLSENTIIVFTSDNGPETITLEDGTWGSTGGLRGRKRSLYEGGVRVPFIVRWPGITPANNVDSTSLLSAVDMLPTFLDITGVEMPTDLQPDGVNVVDAFRGNEITRKKAIMWEWRFYHNDDDFWPMLAIRNDQYVLITNPVLDKVELYNLKIDEQQKNNIVKEYPEVVERLNRQMEEWNTLLPGYSNRPGV